MNFRGATGCVRRDMYQNAMAEKPKEDRSGQESPSTDGEATGNPDAEEIEEMLFDAQVELNLLREALIAVQLEQVRRRAVQKHMTNDAETKTDSNPTVDSIERKLLRRLVALSEREPLPEQTNEQAELAQKLGQLDDDPESSSN